MTYKLNYKFNKKEPQLPRIHHTPIIFVLCTKYIFYCVPLTIHDKIFDYMWLSKFPLQERIAVHHRRPILLLKDQRPAEFSFNQLQHTCLEISHD